jgi:hypothetical protein
MTWDNYGSGDDKWNIGHIIPCSLFNLIVAEEQKECFHYTNLKPQWECENLCNNDILPNGERARDIPNSEKKQKRLDLYINN